jgi:CMP-N,N'-diacetyllegionaminic acid synthase
LNHTANPNSTLKVLGLIPARGGSKGVPHKNIKALCGKPLLQYTAAAALTAKRLSQVVLSTEDEEIAEVGRYCGLEVPFMRPPELAEDQTPMLPVVQHALTWFEKRGQRFDAVCLLQPTNPLRSAAIIDGCIELLEKSDADAALTVLAVPVEHNPHWVYFRDEDGSLRLSTGEAMPISRRQDLPEAFHREGSVYVSRRHTVMEENSLYGKRVVGYRMNAEFSVNIDTLSDWQRAEKLLQGVQS